MAPPDPDLSHDEIEQLLAAWPHDPEARERLIPLVYTELRRLAQHYMQGENAGHTLQPTALINEMYIRLAGVSRMQWQDRNHFIATAATVMRRVLVDYARSRGRQKRGAELSITSLGELDLPFVETGINVVALDDALTALARLDARQSQVVELRFFGGLTVEETAAALDISPATVKREWAMAKAWLHAELSGSLPPA
jgi:RNA polymerase sigma factor (TIGR02999 family)